MTPVAAALAESVRRADGPRERRDALRRVSPSAAAIPTLLEEARAARRRDGEESARLARAALALARLSRSKTLASQAARALGQTCLLLGRPKDALRHLLAASRDADPEDRPRLAPELATALAELGRSEEARAALSDARRGHGERRLRPLLDVTEANLLQRLDRPEEALPLLDRARRSVARRGQRALVAAVDLNRANVLANLHRYEHAEALYRRVTTYQREQGQEAAALQSEYNRAYLVFLRGRFHDALARFRDVRTRFEALGDERHVALCDLDAAEIHLRLNLPEEAAASARRAATVFDRLGIEQDAARARFFVAAAARGVGATAEATATLERALDDFRRLGCEAWAAVCLHRLAEIDRESGSPARAETRAEEAARRLLDLGFVERAGRAECLAATLRIERGDVAGALARLDALRRRVAGLHAPWLLCEVHHRTAQALAASGRSKAALRHALRATRILERHRVAAPPDEYMAAFLRDKADVPAHAVELLLRLGGRGAEARAFEVAEASKGRALLDLLGGRLPGPSTPEAASLCREADELGREIDGFSGRLPEASGNVRGADPHRSEASVRARERRLQSCLDRLAVRDAAAALARSATPPRFDEVASALPRDTTLVEYFRCDSGVFAFVLSREGLNVVRHEIDGERVRGLLARMRFHLDRPEPVTQAYDPVCAEALQRSAEAVLADLDRVLLEPVRGLLTTKRIVVVPHGELHAVPFPALGRDGSALVDDHEVVVAPSTALFLHGLRRPRVASSGCVVLGVPDDAAPLIAEEVSRIGQIHSGTHAFLGRGATRTALARSGGHARWVHVASHAVFRDDDPMQSGLLLGDGWLATKDVYDLRFEADVVVLSGCATGRAEVTEGDDLLGLVRGFLHAGAANLLTSLWQVSDVSTLRFMDRFHRALAVGGSPAAAVRSATLSLRREFPHPHNWAPFVLIGTGDPISGSPS